MSLQLRSAAPAINLNPSARARHLYYAVIAPRSLRVRRASTVSFVQPADVEQLDPFVNAPGLSVRLPAAFSFLSKAKTGADAGVKYARSDDRHATEIGDAKRVVRALIRDLQSLASVLRQDVAPLRGTDQYALMNGWHMWHVPRTANCQCDEIRRIFLNRCRSV